MNIKQKTAFYLSFNLLMLSSINAQSVKLDWVGTVGGNYSDIGTNLAVDPSGNVYTVGGFSQTLDFDFGNGVKNLTATMQDGFVQKLNKNEEYQWAINIGGDNNTDAYAVAVDGNAVYVTGYFYSTVDFDPGPGTHYVTNADGADIFILKLDTLGNFQWVKTMGSDMFCAGFSIAVDKHGNVYSTGAFSKTVDFDPGPGVFDLSSNTCTDIYIEKLDSSGNFVWAKQMGGLSLDYGRSIALGSDGSVYTTGYFQSSADFDPGPATYDLVSSGNYDIFVQKLDSSGNFVWAKSFGSTTMDNGISLTVDNKNNIYVTGNFEGTVDFDPGVGENQKTSEGGDDVFVLKLDKDGNQLWTKTVGGAGDDHGNSVCHDSSDNIYVSGDFSQTVDFDPGPSTYELSSRGSNDIFILKLDSAGNFIWAKSMGGAGTDAANSTKADAYGNLYTTGYYTGTADLDPGADTNNVTGARWEDIFVTRWDTCTSTTNFLTVESCGEYTAPSGKHTWSSSGIYTDTIPDVSGGDSIITIDLTIKNNSTSTIDTNMTGGPYISPGGKIWTSSGIYTDTIPNATGCDSIITINLSIDSTSVGNDSMIVSPSNIILNAAENSSDTFTIASNTSWTVSTDQSWLSLDMNSGSNNATITVTAQANSTSATRYATITVTDSGNNTQTISVKQESDNTPLSFSLSDDHLVFDQKGSYSKTFDIHSNTSWAITCTQDWLTSDIQNGANDSTITVNVQENTSDFKRWATVIIKASGVGAKYVAVDQAGVLQPLSINKTEAPGIKIYPNPVSDEINVVLPDLIKVKSINIFDMYGKLVKTAIPDKYRTNINLTGLLPGVYSIMIITDKKIIVNKFIKSE